MMNTSNFSVLISVYCKENPVYLREAIECIFNQTILPNEIVLVKDGPLTIELENVISEYILKYPIFKILVNNNNLGLGRSLAKGVLACSNEYIARMDTDDKMPNDRFEKELALLDQGYNVVSCWSILYDENFQNTIALKKRPEVHEEILKLAKKRSPICHAGAVFRRSSVLKAGNYQHCNLYEDYHLWVRMLMSGSKFSNVQEPLYFVRTSPSMIVRRGGLHYAINELKTFWYFYKIGFYSLFDFLFNVVIHFPVRVLPVKLRENILRRIWNLKSYVK